MSLGAILAWVAILIAAGALIASERRKAAPATAITGEVSFSLDELVQASQSDPPSSEDDKEASRLAKLLISELKLYNEEKIATGLKQRDLYSRLADDIERSRLTYKERCPRTRTDYFLVELVNRIGQGDPGAFGLESKEPPSRLG